MRTSRNRQALDEFRRQEVRDILGMFCAIKAAYADLVDTAGVNELWVDFLGFDGNNEYEHLHVLGEICCGRRYGNLGHIGDLNSHMPYLGQYQRMVSEWKSSVDPRRLTKADLMRITNVRMH